MKTYKFGILSLALAFLAGLGLASCDDADEYKDAQTDNPSYVDNYNDSTKVAHPDSLAATSWVRGQGMKFNAYGHEIQGYVESIVFEKDSCTVKMSKPANANEDIASTAIWTDESNTAETPKYEYTYSPYTGVVEILKKTEDDKHRVTKKTIFTCVATIGTKEVLTVSHFGDIPSQTYLVKQ